MGNIYPFLSDLKDQFHLMGLNLAVAVLVGAVAMVVSDLHVVRDDRHWCTAVGTIIHMFYQAAGAWVFLLGHAAFSAITSGQLIHNSFRSQGKDQVVFRFHFVIYLAIFFYFLFLRV